MHARGSAALLAVTVYHILWPVELLRGQLPTRSVKHRCHMPECLVWYVGNWEQVPAQMNGRRCNQHTCQNIGNLHV
jgi:hypothetical protein